MMSVNGLTPIVRLVLRLHVSPLRASSGKEVHCLTQADGPRGSHAFYLMDQGATCHCQMACGFVNKPQAVQQREVVP